jgi:CheY-like chemotaxis protein
LTVFPKTNLSISQLEKFRNGLHILIADDNLTNAEILSIMLDSLGHKVKIAANGLEVMKQLEIHAFDMIFMDINMPFMDGIETTKKIRQSNSASQHIPIIAITANIVDKYSESYLSSGMNDYLIKPFGIESIEKKIADVFFQTADHYRWNESL